MSSRSAQLRDAQDPTLATSPEVTCERTMQNDGNLNDRLEIHKNPVPRS